MVAAAADAVYVLPADAVTPSGDVIFGYVGHGPAFVPGNHGPFAPSYPSVAEWWRYNPMFPPRRYYSRVVPLWFRAQDPALLMSPVTSREVIRELQEGNEPVRLLMRDTVVSAVHTMMESREGGHAVFVALLRACELKFDDLQPIVKAACNGRASLMRLMEHGHGYVLE